MTRLETVIGPKQRALEAGFEPVPFKIICECGRERMFAGSSTFFDVYPCSRCFSSGMLFGIKEGKDKT